MEWIEKRQLLEDLFIHRRDVIAHHKGHWMPRGEKWVTTPNGRKAAEEYQPYAPENGDSILYRHVVQGNERVGVYPHALDNTTKTITADFDDKNNTIDEMFTTCLSLKRVLCSNGIPSYIERSHSGSGFHVWVFFESPINCDLATKVMVEAFKQAGLPMKVGSNGYDRLFPCVTKVGKSKSDKKPWVGNIIGLPLQAAAVAKGNCVFLDDSGGTIQDQWSYLSSIQKVPEQLALEFTKHTEHLPTNEPTEAFDGETSGWAYWKALSHIPGQFDRMKGCEAIKEHTIHPNHFDNRQWALGIIGNLAVFTANDDLEDDVIKFAYDIEKNYLPSTGSEDTTEQTMYARKDHLQSDEYPMSCREMFGTGTGWICPKLETCPFNFIAKYDAPASFTIYSPDRSITVQERVELNQLEQRELYSEFRKILPWGDKIPDYLIAKHLLGINPLQVTTYNKKDDSVRSVFQTFQRKEDADILERLLQDKGLTTYTRYENSFWFLSVIKKPRNVAVAVMTDLLRKAEIQIDQDFSNISLSLIGLFQYEFTTAPFFGDIVGCEQLLFSSSGEGINNEYRSV